jgi:uncharacterized protein involved in tolerance to divalent cations
MSAEVVAVLISAPDAETARRLARALVEERLARERDPKGTQSITPEGKVEEASEHLLVAKTRATRVAAVGPCPGPTSLHFGGVKAAHKGWKDAT